MIAVDTSSLRRYFDRKPGFDVNRVERAFAEDDLVIPPVVVTEILSDPGLPGAFALIVASLQTLEIRADFWARAGELRATTLLLGFKAKLADVLIAQSCIDHDVALITHDADFRHFTRAGLQLA